MKYTEYEDRPSIDIWAKLILSLPILILIIETIHIWTNDPSYGMYVALLTILIGIVFIFILPNRYSILDDKIKIGFRGPFSFNIPFETITALRQQRRSTIGINLTTCLSAARALEIIRKKRMTVTITPGDREAFISNFEKSYREWQERYGAQ